MQLSKKDYILKKASQKEATHWEGKHFCDCRTRNIRRWLGVKLYGHRERLNPEDLFADARKEICDSLVSTNK